ncbi:IS110 family transposase [Solitalea lacus]|uniref:IS110 family transposase n=1 Tax=Solitalea lacus TaxID=2911172 RepID=UPI003B846097
MFTILDTHFRVILVNARHVKNVPGHKTDKKDSAWIAKLLASGLLKPSFIPQQSIRELRELVRYKKKLINQRVEHVNRLHKVLQDGNIKLASVVSNVRG